MDHETSSHEPIENWAWKAMDAADQDALRPHVQKRHLRQGEILKVTNNPVEVVYFPVTADIANVVRIPDGRMGMATMVGREGLTGLAAFLADAPIGWDVQVQIEGFAWALPTKVLRERYDDSPALRDQLLDLTHQNQIEAARNAVCNLRHETSQRLSRWLLTTQDRTGRKELPITQEEVADLLGVRRTTIVATSRKFARAGAIRTLRGRTTVQDRTYLKQQACDCYRAQPHQ